jgi:predicted ATP-binding protein involved in virulence
MFEEEWGDDEESLEEVKDEFFIDLRMNVIGCQVKGEHKRIKWDGRWVTEFPALSKGMDVLTETLDRYFGREPVTTDFPVIACYGTNRLWKKKVGYRSAQKDLHRAAGYDGAVNLTTNFLGFDSFVVHAFSYIEAGVFDHQGLGALWLGVTNAVRLVTGWEIVLPTSEDSEILYRHKSGPGLKISQLGDGVRCMIGLVGDLACRCALLNPHYDKAASEKTSGVVLIDEIDLHLHPSWQQTIIVQLQQAFPEIQFIVTTHSPQVLSTVHRDNIRVLGVDASGRVSARKPLVQFYGEPSGEVLQGVMFVDPQPPIPEKTALQRLTALVDQGLYECVEARELVRQLELVLGEKHPQLQRLKRSILRQRVLRK